LKHGWNLKDLMKEGRNLEMTTKNAELIEGTKEEYPESEDEVL